jgi:tryptophan-rich sensory protein
MSRWWALACFIALCLSVAAIAGWATSSSVTTWYLTLQKPSWTPPNWLFGPVWTLLYIMMAVAAWRVWQRVGNRSSALAMFYIQLAMNFAWSFAFFSAQSPLLGAIVIVALWLAIVATIRLFLQQDRVAGFLLLPYICWVSYASALNLAIWIMNPAG